MNHKLLSNATKIWKNLSVATKLSTAKWRNISILKKGKYSPCSVNNRTLCCKQVISSWTFKNQQTDKTYTIFHEVNCSGAYVVYLMECFLCKNQYVGKSETSFNIRLNNNRRKLQAIFSVNTTFNWCHLFVWVQLHCSFDGRLS